LKKVLIKKKGGGGGVCLRKQTMPPIFLGEGIFKFPYKKIFLFVKGIKQEEKKIQ